MSQITRFTRARQLKASVWPGRAKDGYGNFNAAAMMAGHLGIVPGGADSPDGRTCTGFGKAGVSRSMLDPRAGLRFTAGMATLHHPAHECRDFASHPTGTPGSFPSSSPTDLPRT